MRKGGESYFTTRLVKSVRSAMFRPAVKGKWLVSVSTKDLCFESSNQIFDRGKKLGSYLRLNRFNRPETNCPINFSKKLSNRGNFYPISVRLNSRLPPRNECHTGYDSIYKARGKKIFFLQRNFINVRLKSKRKLQFIRRISVVPFSLSLFLSLL